MKEKLFFDNDIILDISIERDTLDLFNNPVAADQRSDEQVLARNPTGFNAPHFAVF
jgi:hypothetical protein